ncbi:hypothetical protein [Cardinium endosymbiont of Culicoides punctatus]|uniref:hypothetical protein n=1 Tax=Cardinium endosymbiont of Culicoides punctatus TaxID=2304601 RepID=UPI0010586E70|nr:hypothetical protein [Cardinium endosymbiont of Culicoides punctatus]TDG95484.1 hypothetical protein CCPUN_03040 [Cardinium endosymbiont of Culicoides punctatus]
MAKMNKHIYNRFRYIYVLKSIILLLYLWLQSCSHPARNISLHLVNKMNNSADYNITLKPLQPVGSFGEKIPINLLVFFCCHHPIKSDLKPVAKNTGKEDGSQYVYLETSTITKKNLKIRVKNIKIKSRNGYLETSSGEKLENGFEFGCTENKHKLFFTCSQEDFDGDLKIELKTVLVENDNERPFTNRKTSCTLRIQKPFDKDESEDDEQSQTDLNKEKKTLEQALAESQENLEKVIQEKEMLEKKLAKGQEDLDIVVQEEGSITRSIRSSE